MINIDQNLFLFINSFVGKSPFFDGFAKLMVNEFFIPTTLSLILFGIWFYWDNPKDKDLKQKYVVSGILAVILASTAVVSLINNIFQRLRPFEVLDVNLLFYTPTDPSFPSNATVVVFALATAIYLAEKRWGWIALFLAGFYGFLRIFVGIHFPLDIIVGAIIGIGSVLIVNLFDKILMQILLFLRKALASLKLEEFS
ncbi:phosphatase PAP2 family protein [Patescibacteria group bacterium]|nr:phosphatase PAP2 family protein [Patescibacteria group bacterium]